MLNFVLSYFKDIVLDVLKYDMKKSICFCLLNAVLSRICPWLYAVEYIFRLRLQNRFSIVAPQTVARVEALVLSSIAARCSKGGG